MPGADLFTCQPKEIESFFIIDVKPHLSRSALRNFFFVCCEFMI